MNKTYKICLVASLVFVPMVSFAALEGIRDLIVDIGGIVSILIPIAVGLALLFFLWGLANFILKSGDPKAKEEGKNKMIWGIIALFVMISVWGIVMFIQDELGIYNEGGIEAPEIPDPLGGGSTAI